MRPTGTEYANKKFFLGRGVKRANLGDLGKEENQPNTQFPAENEGKIEQNWVKIRKKEQKLEKIRTF